MGGGLNTSEMFEKLESMREVVTEVNAQFKNPVRPHFASESLPRVHSSNG